MFVYSRFLAFIESEVKLFSLLLSLILTVFKYYPYVYYVAVDIMLVAIL